jgi:hypothetical protein
MNNTLVNSLHRKQLFSQTFIRSESLDDKDKFLEWFRGFTDGEGHFYINIRSLTVCSFRYELHLHYDDRPLLELIKKKIGMGNVYTSANQKTSTFLVSTLNEIRVIIEIFSKFPLNSSKHINFLSFKRAFELYTTVENRSESTLQEIAKIKKDMNSKRVEFTMPESHKPLITPYWLLGFVEGEGSFSVRRASGKFELAFAVAQISKDEILMNSIKDFFNNLTGAEKYGSDVVKKSFYTPKGANHKQTIQLVITRGDYIGDILIDFFNNMVWYSKKVLDFQDWVLIYKLKERGHHYQEEGVRLLNLLVNQMNNSRLSTSSQARKPTIDRNQLLIDITNMLNGPSNFEIKDGRKIIKSSNKLAGVGKQTIVQLLEEKGGIIKTFYSISDCAKHLGASRTFVYAWLKKGKPFLFEDKRVLVKYDDKNESSD